MTVRGITPHKRTARRAAKIADRADDSLPAARGYRMPAEWEPHESTWLAWPHYKGDWPGKFDPIPWVYAEIIRNLGRHERVDLIVNDATSEKKVRAVLEKSDALSEAVRFHHWNTDRVWMRDSGCIFLTPDENGSSPNLLALHFQFNAWAKYSNYAADGKVGASMAIASGATVFRPVTRDQGKKNRVVLEGGSIDVNGTGTLITTEECLLSTTQERNPAMDRAGYEQMFASYFGVRSVIWLDSGIAGDDTHGHVDDITRFVAPNVVITMVESDERRENYIPLRANLGRLKNARTAEGKKLDIVELPMPRPVVFEGRQLPASYANFYIANGVVLVPVFNDPNDRIALTTLSDLFPTREIIPIYSGDLIWGFGALHCMTQQLPARATSVTL